jgi:Tol biopolymer transport system component
VTHRCLLAGFGVLLAIGTLLAGPAWADGPIPLPTDLPCDKRPPPPTPTTVPPPPPGEFGPTWAPTESVIAFTRNVNGGATTVEVVNSKNLRRWSLGPGGNPSWSPDGHSLTFIRALPAPKPPKPPTCIATVVDVFVASRDGRSQIDLTNSEDSSASSPTWSPDGSEIAYVDNHAGKSTIAVVSMKDRQERSLSTLSVGWFQKLAWSPDSQQIAFSGSNTEMPGTRIWVVNADGSGLRLMTHASRYQDYDPTWSPDGRMIAFTRSVPLEDAGHSRIWVMNADGSGKHQVSRHLSAGSASDSSPEWVAGGRALEFQRSFGVYGSGSYMVNLDGSDQRAVTTVIGRRAVPYLADAVRSPDGRQLAVTRRRSPTNPTWRIWIFSLPNLRATLVPW